MDDDVNADLIGSWNWTRTTGGLAGITETPESTGDERKLEITADSIKGYLNDSLVYKTGYTVGIRESIMFNAPREMLISDEDFRRIIELERSSLVLIDDCYDCYTNTYSKE